MGVKTCNREDCYNIMCDTYVSNVGYICRECKNEFKTYLNKHNITPETDSKIIVELKKFMDTSKDSYTDGTPISVDDFFKQNTDNE